MVSRSQQVVTDTEEVEYQTVHRERSLCVRSGCEPAHLSLALPRRLVRYLSPRMLYAITASASCAFEWRSRSRSPMIDLYLKKAFSTRACRW